MMVSTRNFQLLYSRSEPTHDSRRVHKSSRKCCPSRFKRNQIRFQIEFIELIPVFPSGMIFKHHIIYFRGIPIGSGLLSNSHLLQWKLKWQQMCFHAFVLICFWKTKIDRNISLRINRVFKRQMTHYALSSTLDVF